MSTNSSFDCNGSKVALNEDVPEVVLLDFGGSVEEQLCFISSVVIRTTSTSPRMSVFS